MENTDSNKTEQAKIKDKLNGWIEKGYNKQAVAAYGLSTEMFRPILDTGLFTPHTVTLDYQRKLVEGGKYLYYAVPIFERVKETNPQFANELVAKSGLLKPAYEAAKTILTAKAYALSQAITDCFYEKTGINVRGEDDVYGLALKIASRELNSFLNQTSDYGFSGTDLDSIRMTADKELIGRIKNQFSKEFLTEVLHECFQRRGVIIYFNKDLFTGNRVLPGYEDEAEILIVTDKKLSVSVIEGIEVLSDADMRAINGSL